MLHRWAGNILFAMLLACTVAPRIAGQDIDSAVANQNRSVPTIAAEIHDPAERAAFLGLYRTQDPRSLNALSQAFVLQYPRSAFLATAYEIAARSSFDLGDFTSGLEFARQSLLITPENPLLLVAVADVQARSGAPAAAMENAQAALDYFDGSARPMAFSAKDWPDIERTQRATAWFVIGRVQAAQALALPAGASRRTLLDKSAYSILHARALAPDDSEIIYLLGIIHSAEGKVEEAKADFGMVCKQGGDLAPKAREQLLAIYDVENPTNKRDKHTTGFLAFLRSAEKARPAAFDQPATSTTELNVHLPAYAGSAACKECHSNVYREWSQTGMAKMLRPYRSKNMIGDFSKNNEFYAGDEITYRDGKLQITPALDRKLYARMVLRKGRHYFDVKQSDGHWHTYPVDYTIGSKWQQAYATTLPNGEIHVFPIQYSTIQKKWVDYWQVIDSAGSERSNPYTWERLDTATDYRANCAVCHTSQLRNAGDGPINPSQFVFREPGIGCEMCHGPSADHVSAMKKGDERPKGALDPPVDFEQITGHQFVRICAQCHMQSNVHSPSPRGEVNYSSIGKFFLTNKSIPLDEFSRKGFYKDGRFTQTTFIVEALERSQCFRKGNVSCGTCHDPHRPDAASNPTSLKFRDDPDRMCTGCHTQLQNASSAAAHTHHPINSEASRCVSCHMPRIANGLLFRARSHQIDDIPNAETTMRYGEHGSPNACLLCHTTQSPQWVQSSLQSWKTISSNTNPLTGGRATFIQRNP